MGRADRLHAKSRRLAHGHEHPPERLPPRSTRRALTGAADIVDILHRVGIAAPPKAVFAALTTLEGIRGWWISTAEGTALEGGAFAFRNNRLTVAEATPTLIRWHYTGAATEWVGTAIEFRPEWRQNQTILLFRHADWMEPSEFMHHCSTKWAVFLLSLKDFVETGTGRPEPGDTKITIDS